MAGTKLIVSITERSKRALDRAYEAFPNLRKREVVDLALQKGVDMLLGQPDEAPSPESDVQEDEDHDQGTEEYSLFSHYENSEEESLGESGEEQSDEADEDSLNE